MKKLISIVIPIYNEEKGIVPLKEELDKTLSGLPDYQFEIIFVNDGSRDNSVLELCRLASGDHRIKVIDFARNFGKEIALSAGCHHAKGDAVVTMDADLQHPPNLIAEFIKQWQEGYEVVYTVRLENKGASFMKRSTSRLYWWLFDKITSVQTEPHSTDYRLMDKKVIDVFRKFPERARLFRGIIDWIGFKRTRVEFVAAERRVGTATYSYNKLIGLAINSITSFSLMPLKMAGYFGIAITFLSLAFLPIMFIVRSFFNPTMFSPIAFVIVANTLLIGVVLICLGLIALYIARIHDEVVGRPLYIIRDTVNIEK